MGKYFGTDGIRGIANIELDPDLAFRAGKALGAYLLNKYPKEIFVGIGKDTRLSGDMIESSITSGLLSSGISCKSFGIIPTPAVSKLIGLTDCVAGVVISASHNPVCDNGIKFFNRDGFKFDDANETIIEELIDSSASLPLAKSGEVGSAFIKTDAPQIYTEAILKEFKNLPIKGLKILVDCAFGSTYWTTPFT